MRLAVNNATVTFSSGWNPAATDIYLLDAFNNGTVNFNGSSTIPGSSDSNATHIYINSNSALNDNGSLTFSAGTGSFTGNFVVLHLGSTSAINVGNPISIPAASLTVNDASGVVVSGYLNGNGNINVYPNSTLSITGAVRFAADNVGAELLNVSSGGSVSLGSIVLGDNGTGAAVPGTLGAIYLQSGSAFNITSSTTPITAVGNQGSAVFSIGAAGDGTPPVSSNRSSTANALLNDFGYVSVSTGASIGPMPTGGVFSTANVPGELDIGGNYRTGAAVSGGNGLMDVNGGTVTVNAFLTLAASTTDQQFGALNILNGGTVTVNSFGKSGSATYFTGASTIAMSTSIYGSYSVINVVNSTLNNGIGTAAAQGLGTFPNNPINLGGSVSNNNSLVNGLPTGILNIDGTSAVVQTGYIQARPISFNTTSGAASNSTDFSGEPSSFVNFNGGTLKTNTFANNSQTGMIAQTIAGVYVYNAGAVLSGGVATGGTQTLLVGLSAPPGAGIATQTLTAANGGITNVGSGYLTPPIVEITDSTGFDATGYATISGGQVSGVTITNPGFNLTNPQITFIGGGGSGASASVPAPTFNNSTGGLTIQGGSVTFNLTGTYALTAGNGGGGGVTLSDGIKTGQELYSFNSDGTLPAAGSGLGNNPNSAGTFYGNSYPGIRNNTSTYTGPTVIESGSLQLTTAASASVSQTGNTAFYASSAFAAANNNIPFSSAIIVGDTAADSAASFNITAIGGAGGFELSPGLTSSTTYNGNTYTYTSKPQVLAGFATITGNSTHGLTVGLASGSVTASSYINATTVVTTSTGNNFGGYAFANGSTNNGGVITPTVNNSVISPGYTASGNALVNLNNTAQYQSANPVYGTIVAETALGGAPTVTFDTRQGNATSGASTTTGALTIGNGTSTLTTLGAGGTYYWKLDLSNASSGATNMPGTATVSPGLTSGAPAAGAAWDELILDNLAVSSTIGAITGSGTTNAFTIEGTDFSSTAANTFQNTSSYSWVIARVNQAYSASNSQQLLASLSLNTAGLPAAAPGYQYFLSSQVDPGNLPGAYDVVVNYAPAPEPTGLALLGVGAAPLLRRRRKP